jgi:hypothetical protein
MSINANDIVEFAKKFLGTQYVWGGNSLTNGVDCSGLTQQIMKHFGIDIPRTTYDQIGEGKGVSIKGLRAGDLVFFDTNKNVKGADHVGIYIGNGKMIHAPRPGKGVEITSMTSGYYMDSFMGGRRLNGVKAVGAKDSDYDISSKEVKMTPEELASSYGWAYGFLNSNKELKKLFNDAVKGSWTPDKFQAEVRDTKWWKETSNTRREAQVTKSTDPATWKAMIDAAKIQVTQLAAEIGAAIPSNKLTSIAQNVVETGMDEDQLRYALGEYVGFTKNGTLKGEAAMHEYTMKQYAYNMGVQLSDQTIKNQAQRVVRKVATTQDFEDEVRQSAKSMYPAYEDQIDAGQTLADIASPYMQMMSAELQIPDGDINVSTPLIKSALNGLDAKGKPGGTTLYDFQRQLRNDPRWAQTDKAQDNVMNTGLEVLKNMGLIGE